MQSPDKQVFICALFLIKASMNPHATRTFIKELRRGKNSVPDAGICILYVAGCKQARTTFPEIVAGHLYISVELKSRRWKMKEQYALGMEAFISGVPMSWILGREGSSSW